MTRREEYHLYLKSEAWKQLRRLVLRRDKSQCVKCGATKRLTVHHIKYPKHLGTEPLDYMQTLCSSCHNVLHGRSPDNRIERRKIQKINRRRRIRMKQDKQFAKTVKKSSPVKVFSKEEIAEYQPR